MSTESLGAAEPIDHGVAGRSARREHERRAANDAARVAAQREEIRARLGGGVIGRAVAGLRVDGAPRRATTAWASGADGERVVGARLDALAARGVVTLHDRRIPGSRANIDHLAIAPGGVWVIDAKRYRGKRPSLAFEGSVLGFGGRGRLVVGGRRQDRLVDGIVGQVERVRSLVPDGVPVRGMLCFVEADWPLLAGSFSVDGVRVVWPRRMAKEIRASREAVLDVDAVARSLASAFPPA